MFRAGKIEMSQHELFLHIILCWPMESEEAINFVISYMISACLALLLHIGSASPWIQSLHSVHTHIIISGGSRK
jgi:hypothetical protein